MKKKNMRRVNFVMVFFITLLMSGFFVNANEYVNKKFTYRNEFISYLQDDNTISLCIQIDNFEIKYSDKGSKILIENFGNSLEPGKPNLPSKIYAIAIPPKAEVTDVSFSTEDAIIVPGIHQIKPVPITRTLSEENPAFYEKQKRIYDNNYNSIYKQNKKYPEKVGEFIGNARYRKYNLVDVRINPFIYEPQIGQIKYYPKITIDISYTFPNNKDEIMFDNIKSTEKTAEEIIINYEQTKEWYTKQPISEKGLYDYVIVTLDSLTSYVTPLVNWEDSKGRNVKVVTISWINSNYAGYDLSEKIRNFLREKYPSSEWGIEYVCIIGDYDDIPMRRCWQDIGYGKPETDYYYAELSYPDSQSWDADLDNRYGENSDPIDFYSEINVGRIPWSDPTIVQHICEKSALYEQKNDPSFKKNILLLGAFFWPDTDNAVLMEEKVNQDWMTDWSMTRMYEQGYTLYSSDYNLDYNIVNSVWSQGSYAFVNWAGHGSPTSCHVWFSKGSDFVNTDTCDNLNDEYPSIIFADACSNSDTDYINIGKAMLRQGAVGFVGSTKVALGRPAWNNPSDGSSQSLDYFFTTFVTSNDYTQGQAHQKALREMYTQGLWNYLKYETFEWGSLWGNPDLGMAPIGDYPIIEIGDISIGIGTIETSISNTGTAEAKNVNWSIKVNGGLFGFMDFVTHDSIKTLEIEETVIINSKEMIFGFGPFELEIKASSNFIIKNGFALGPILIIIN